MLFSYVDCDCVFFKFLVNLGTFVTKGSFTYLCIILQYYFRISGSAFAKFILLAKKVGCQLLTGVQKNEWSVKKMKHV